MEYADFPNQVRVGSDICGNLSSAESREVLITNGIGGYGSMTLANSLTRSYHGLLVATLRSPLDRTLLLSKINETITYMGESYPLYTDRRKVSDVESTKNLNSQPNQSLHSEGGHPTASEPDAYLQSRSYPFQGRHVHSETCCEGEFVAPAGYRFLNSFHLMGTVPVFHYAIQDVVLEKKLWMKRGKSTVYITYHVQRASQPVLLHLDALVNCRNHHERTSASNPRFRHSVQLGPSSSSVMVQFKKDQVETTLSLFMSSGRAESINEWSTDFVLSEERSRGYDEWDDHLHAATFKVELLPEQMVTFAATAQDEVSDIHLDGEAEFASQQAYEAQLLKVFHHSRMSLCRRNMVSQPSSDNNFRMTSPFLSISSEALGIDMTSNTEFDIRQLVLAADQFIMSRGSGYSILAGFHWFTDWTRDTMISLPGLTLVTGRFEVARSILETYSKYVRNGMLPNRFPDDGSAPADSDYNNVDGTLWFFEAIRSYFAATGDDDFLRGVFPVLQRIIENHCKGTRFGIRQDEDGLLNAGAEGVALTWMDAVAKVVYTQRDGKPVEVAALWYNALKCMSFFASVLGHTEESKVFSKMARKTEQSFQQKFWNRQTLYCFDVVDGGSKKDESDASFRPNQLIAASLHWSPLSAEQCASILDVCAKLLLTPKSIRSLSSKDKEYKGVYQGDVYSRDSSYHQGVGWVWLLGPFIQTRCRVLGNRDKSRQYLNSLLESHLTEAGMGQVSELFDGEPPYQAKGCIAQAWSVAELLRAWISTESVYCCEEAQVASSTISASKNHAYPL